MSSRTEVVLKVGEKCPKCRGTGVYGRAAQHRSCFWCMGAGLVSPESARRTYWWFLNHPDRGLDIVVMGLPKILPVMSTLFIRRNLDPSSKAYAHIQVRVVNTKGKCVRQYGPMREGFTWDSFFKWAEEVQLVVVKDYMVRSWRTFKLVPKCLADRDGTKVLPFPVGKLEPLFSSHFSSPSSFKGEGDEKDEKKGEEVKLNQS